jgi:type I restriction enzyme S subunit
MSKLEKYPKYKDSGVEWIEKIPEEWKALSNKYIFRLKKNLVGKRSSEYELLSLTLGGIIKRDMENPEGKFPAEFDNYQEVKKDDFVFCMFDVEETPRTVGLSKYDGMITGAYTVMTNTVMDNSFLYYFYLNLDTKKRMKFLYKGLRNTIPKDSFFAFKTLVPPKQEQIKIANYLDQKTAQIDKTITLKEQLIEKLKEQRQVLINDAITKGLDKNAKMKDSGVEWIGDIPEHWEVRRLGTLGLFSKGGGVSRENLTKSGFQVILYGDIYTKYETFVIDTEYFIDENIAKKSIQIQKFDILFTGSGETKEDIGKCITFLGLKETYAGGDIIIFRPKSESESLFLTYALNSLNSQKQKIAMSKGEIIVHIYSSKLKNLYIAYPPLEEQKQIAKYLDKQTKKIDVAIELQQKQIEKLKEYKATLIDSVVTGKVRVAE